MNSAMIERWVEETLRFDTSTQMLARIAVNDVEVAGGCILLGIG